LRRLSVSLPKPPLPIRPDFHAESECTLQQEKGKNLFLCYNGPVMEKKNDSQKTSTATKSKPLILKNSVIVAGHPRSGTSLACQLLASAGVVFPMDTGPDIYNPEGYFELLAAKELEKSLLREAMTDDNVESMNAVIRRLNQPGKLTGLKIVHIPALFFYSHVARNLRIVFVFRHPAEVKSSMLRRGISQFMLSWFENNNALVAALENNPKSIIISYENLLKGGPTVNKLFKKIGLNVDNTVIRREYRTQKDSRMILEKHEDNLYKTLLRLERECRH